VKAERRVPPSDSTQGSARMLEGVGMAVAVAVDMVAAAAEEGGDAMHHGATQPLPPGVTCVGRLVRTPPAPIVPLHVPTQAVPCG
jgi:hypothetical protein